MNQSHARSVAKEKGESSHTRPMAKRKDESVSHKANEKDELVFTQSQWPRSKDESVSQGKG